jgi:hypothetical protein
LATEESTTTKEFFSGMTSLSLFFEFALAMVIPGALVILLAALALDEQVMADRRFPGTLDCRGISRHLVHRARR